MGSRGRARAGRQAGEVGATEIAELQELWLPHKLSKSAGMGCLQPPKISLQRCVKNIPPRFQDSIRKCSASHPQIALRRNILASLNLAGMFLHYSVESRMRQFFGSILKLRSDLQKTQHGGKISFTKSSSISFENPSQVYEETTEGEAERILRKSGSRGTLALSCF